MDIHGENSADHAAVRTIHKSACGRSDEAELVDWLQIDNEVLVALVAEVEGHPVGHILFSRMGIVTAAGEVPAVALAPVAVHPEHQGTGIGGALICEGLEQLRRTSKFLFE